MPAVIIERSSSPNMIAGASLLPVCGALACVPDGAEPVLPAECSGGAVVVAECDVVVLISPAPISALCMPEVVSVAVVISVAVVPEVSVPDVVPADTVVVPDVVVVCTSAVVSGVVADVVVDSAAVVDEVVVSRSPDVCTAVVVTGTVV